MKKKLLAIFSALLIACSLGAVALSVNAQDNAKEAASIVQVYYSATDIGGGSGTGIIVTLTDDCGTYWNAYDSNFVSYTDSTGANKLTTVETCGTGIAINRNGAAPVAGDVITIKAGFIWQGKEIKEDTVFLCENPAGHALWTVVRASTFVYSSAIDEAKTEHEPANIMQSEDWHSVLINMGDTNRFATLDTHMSNCKKDFLEIDKRLITYTDAQGNDKLWSVRFRENYIFVDTLGQNYEAGDILTIKAGLVWGDYQIKKDLVYVCNGTNTAFTVDGGNFSVASLNIHNNTSFGSPAIQVNVTGITGATFGTYQNCISTMNIEYVDVNGNVKEIADFTCLDEAGVFNGKYFLFRFTDTAYYIQTGDIFTLKAGSYVQAGSKRFTLSSNVAYKITDATTGQYALYEPCVVTFKNDDGSIISTTTYGKGETVVVPENPTKEADETYTYTFDGWDSEVATTATGDATYIATYKGTYINYTVTFKNDNGDVLSSETYHYGDAVTEPENPTKEADESYTYTFAGWDNDVTTVTGNAVYTATYTKTSIGYVIIFKNYDGSIISEDTYELGATVVEPNAPTREADETYTYTFAGWDKDITTVTGNAIYTATYTSEPINYTITFKNDNGDVLSTETYHYGDVVTEPETPTKEADNAYTYTFAGWDNDVTAVTGNAVYTATYTSEPISYTVTFKNEDGTVLSTETYHYGDAVTEPETPTKEADNAYTYTFAGWDNDVTTVTGNAVYTATYTSEPINYTITFKNDNGTVLSTETYHYGDTVVEPENPTKEADNAYTYIFAGWDNDVTAVTGNATYTATYTSEPISYTVTFKNDNGDVLSTETYHYGDTVVEPENPTKDADETYTYTFAGWDKDVTTVTGNAIYTATYTSEAISYTVTFVDEDGTVLSTKTYKYGDTVIMPENPTKEADNAYTYIFAGWDNDVTAVTGNATYTATYKSEPIYYTITFKNDNGDVLSTKTYKYGDTVIEPSATPTKQADNAYTYTFAGWDKDITTVTGNAIYTATYTSEPINYTVTFKNDNGDVLSTETYHYGDTVTEPETPTKDADETYTYTFAGWDKDITTVIGDAVYTATYTKSSVGYVVTFVNYDGMTISEKVYGYGDTVDIPENPTRPADKINTYIFAGWDNDVTAVTGNATYTATYTSEPISYTVTFVNEDGTVLSTKTYKYGDTVIEPSATPTKQADNAYTYTFKGWDKVVTNVTGNTTYTATYTSEPINYTVTFKNDNGDVLSSETYHYGDAVTEPETPTKEADNAYTYTFNGWDKEVTAVTGNAVYTATYTSEPIHYTVTFKNDNGDVLSEKTDYCYGDSIVLPSNPEKEGYVFAGWQYNGSDYNLATPVTQSIILVAKWVEEVADPGEQSFTVVFKDEDGSVLSEAVYTYGEAVTAPQAPSKAADNKYTYEFGGWDKVVTNCIADATYTATYKATYINYTVTFKNEDGTVLLERTDYHYGDAVTEPSSTPTKAADNAYTYTFSGWDNDVTAVTGNAVYTATYTSEPINYTVTFKNEDGTILLEKTDYHYGDAVTEPSTTPTKQADKKYRYTFNGWDKAVTAVSGNTIYTAQYKQEYINYTITFLDDDGDVLLTKTDYYYGQEVVAPETPVKAEDNKYTYVFSNWDKTVTSCLGDATYTATYKATAKNYTVTFKNEDGTILLERTDYHYGDAVTEPSVTPTKAADNAYTYTFSGWDKSVVAVTGNAVYTATYTSEAINYTVTFVDEDGTVLLSKTDYKFGDTVSLPANNPVKPATNVYKYTFNGWDKPVTTVQGNVTYTAIYLEELVEYTIVFKNGDEIISSATYNYGDAVITPSTTPTKEADETYTYTFKDWDKVVTNCVGDATYTATYTSTFINYTVTFKNEDGSIILEKTDYHYGDKVTEPQAPSKAADNTYTYTFSGWGKEVVNVNGNADYTATFSREYIEYTIVFKNGNETISSATYHYGATVTTPSVTPAKPADETYTYTFAGWDIDVVVVTGDATYTATYTPTFINYTVTFKNYNGDVISTKTDYHYGDTVDMPTTTPTKDADATYTYTFSGWDKTVVSVAGNTTYTANYISTYIEYTVTFKAEGGSIISSVTCHYGDVITAPQAPSKAADNTYTYAFGGWDKTVVPCAGNAIYTATYVPTYIEYTVTFRDTTDEVIKSETYHYGEKINKPANPTKEGYVFSHWTVGGAEYDFNTLVAGDVTLVAKWIKDVPEVGEDGGVKCGGAIGISAVIPAMLATLCAGVIVGAKRKRK